MPSTVSPTPPQMKKKANTVYIICDNPECDETIILTVHSHEAFLRFREIELPGDWRHVMVDGWVGTFHACSQKCEDELRASHQP